MKVYRTKAIKQLSHNLDTMLSFTLERVEEALRDIEKNPDGLSQEEGVDMMRYLLGKKELSMSEIVANLNGMLFAAVDTTSNTSQWLLYCLATNPEVQELLYQEITKQVLPGHVPTADDINKMSYLKSCLKESQRMFPVSISFVRIPTKEITLGGYQIPSGAMVHAQTYVTGHDSENFPEPENFRPERWMRDAPIKPQPFTYLPFAVGNRACVGRRVANLEISLLLARILQTYKIEHVGEKPQIVFQSTLVTKKPVQLKFVKR